MSNTVVMAYVSRVRVLHLGLRLARQSAMRCPYNLRRTNAIHHTLASLGLQLCIAFHIVDAVEADQHIAARGACASAMLQDCRAFHVVVPLDTFRTQCHPPNNYLTLAAGVPCDPHCGAFYIRITLLLRERIAFDIAVLFKSSRNPPLRAHVCFR